mgnify:FL=1
MNDESVFTIGAWAYEHPQYGQRWRSYVICPHGLSFYINDDFLFEINALKASDQYRNHVRQDFCSDAACTAYLEHANAPSAAATVTRLGRASKGNSRF